MTRILVKLVFLGFGLLLHTHLMASSANKKSYGHKLNRVSFVLQQKQWVSTNTAKVQVEVNATLTSSNLVSARQMIIKKLKAILPVDWHINQFQRSQDSSGLTRLYVVAQSRIKTADAAKIEKGIGNVSAKGMKFSLQTMDFKPSLKEQENSLKLLRAKLYKEIKDELQSLNSVYVKQHYSVYDIQFFIGDLPSLGRNNQYRQAQIKPLMLYAKSQGSTSTGIDVKMTALVTLASSRVIKRS